MVRCPSPSPIAGQLLAVVALFFVFSPHGARGTTHGSFASSSPFLHRVALEQSLAESHLNVETEETKRQMLNVLGIDELPQPRQGIVPHQYMMHIYQKMSTRKSDYKGVNTIRGFVDVGESPFSWSVRLRLSTGFFFFPFSFFIFFWHSVFSWFIAYRPLTNVLVFCSRGRWQLERPKISSDIHF